MTNVLLILPLNGLSSMYVIPDVSEEELAVLKDVSATDFEKRDDLLAYLEAYAKIVCATNPDSHSHHPHVSTRWKEKGWQMHKVRRSKGPMLLPDNCLMVHATQIGI